MLAPDTGRNYFHINLLQKIELLDEKAENKPKRWRDWSIFKIICKLGLLRIGRGLWQKIQWLVYSYYRFTGWRLLLYRLGKKRSSQNIFPYMGIGCGAVGWAFATDTRDLRFKSSHWQILFTFNCIEKTNIKKKGRKVFLIFYHLPKAATGTTDELTSASYATGPAGGWSRRPASRTSSMESSATSTRYQCVSQ